MVINGSLTVLSAVALQKRTGGIYVGSCCTYITEPQGQVPLPQLVKQENGGLQSHPTFESSYSCDSCLLLLMFSALKTLLLKVAIVVAIIYYQMF